MGLFEIRTLQRRSCRIEESHQTFRLLKIFISLSMRGNVSSHGYLRLPLADLPAVPVYIYNDGSIIRDVILLYRRDNLEKK